MFFKKRQEAGMIYRQGDLLLRKVDPKDIPDQFEPREQCATTIGYGEVTGHHHTLDEAQWIVHPEADVEQFALDGDPKVPAKMYLAVNNGTVLRHQEHAPINVDSGTYEVIRQREYDPVEGFRRVAD